MKINVSISSRNAAAQLETTIRLLKNLESGKNEVRYVVGLDNDDAASCVRMKKEFNGDPSVVLSVEDRTITIGSVWNRCVKLYDADIYIPLGDDTMCLTQNWDMYATAMAKQFIMSSGFCSFSPNSVLFFVIRKEWIDAAGEMFPEWFPYWFNDTWLHELYEFTVGEDISVVKEYVFGGKHGQTRGMRDLHFWWGFFNATRSERLMHALRIRHLLKLEDPKPEAMKRIIDKWDARDWRMLEIIPDLIKQQTIDNKPPTPNYRIAKMKAEDYLKQHGLKIWENF